jgi:SAM-dependent methyltransferase
MHQSTEYQGKSVLDIMSECAVNRNNAVEAHIVKHFGLDMLGEPRTILEFGAGRGEFIDRFLNHPLLKTMAVEIDEGYVSLLSGRHATYRTLEEVPGNVDFIFTVDVLEHIEDDERILRLLHRTLGHGGMLLVYVPARPELYSAFDTSIGHFRRYRLGELRRKAVGAGFVVATLRYDDFLGYFASVYNKFTTDGSLDPRAVRLYDRWFVPLSGFLESVIRPPIGKNILLVARKA